MNTTQRYLMNTASYSTRSLTALGLVFGLASAAIAQSDTPALADRQQQLTEQLQTIENSQPGLSLNGRLLSSYRGSEIAGSALAAQSPTMETGAFTQADLLLTARPAKDSRAVLKARIHQDWQKAYHEGPNPFNLYWWSYGGKALDGKMDFAAGDMRLSYTPLTATMPLPEVLQEPEVFLRRKEEAMAHRNLDSKDAGRLIQGLDAHYQSGALGFLENIGVRGTVGRLRNQSKKPDQLFFDFGATDRYLLAGHSSLSLFSSTLGFNYLRSFDRVNSSRNIGLGVGHPVLDMSVLEYYDNDVMSITLNSNIGKLAKAGNWSLGLDVEFAQSNSETASDYLVADTSYRYDFIGGLPYREGGDSTLYVRESANTKLKTRRKVPIGAWDGQALRAGLQAGTFSGSKFDLSAQGYFVNNSVNFESDLAQSPAFAGYQAVLNSDSWLADGTLPLGSLSTLESYYNSQFTTQPLTQRNSMSSGEDTAAGYLLYNNFERHQFFRNAWENTAFNRSELLALQRAGGRNRNGLIVPGAIDDALSLIMPMGHATPNRTGVRFGTDLFAADRAIELNARVDMLKEVENALEATSFTGYGVGLALEAGRLAGISHPIRLQGAYERAKAEGKIAADVSSERSAVRMGAGLDMLVWGPIHFLAGYQQLDKVLYKDNFGELSVNESLLMGGLRYNIVTGSSILLEYGKLSTEYKRADALLPASAASYKLDHNLVTAEVEVHF